MKKIQATQWLRTRRETNTQKMQLSLVLKSVLRITYKQNLFEDKDYSSPHGKEATKANG